MQALPKMQLALTIFERAVLAHLTADWLLQTEWMAKNKADLCHPAGYVHAAIHASLLGLALGWVGGVALGIIHLLIDTGRPVNWWIRIFKKCEASPNLDIIRIGADQVLHIAIIAAWVSFA
jgi:hypothetical protein